MGNAKEYSDYYTVALISHACKVMLKILQAMFQFTSVVSGSSQPYGLQDASLPCPSPTPRACLDTCASSWWCHPTISSSVIPFSSCLQSFPASGSFSSESVLCIRWPKYWSFSFIISPSNEYSELISFRIDWLFSLQSRDSQESSPTPQFKSINSSALSFLYGPTPTSIIPRPGYILGCGCPTRPGLHNHHQKVLLLNPYCQVCSGG